MKVEVTKSFKWAPDGNHVREVQAGEQLEGRGAEVALQLNSGRVLESVPAVIIDSAGAAPAKIPVVASPAERQVLRLPLLDEFVSRGYKAEDYQVFIAARTEEAKANGLDVIVAAPPPGTEEPPPASTPPPPPPAPAAEAPPAPPAESKRASRKKG